MADSPGNPFEVLCPAILYNALCWSEEFTWTAAVATGFPGAEMTCPKLPVAVCPKLWVTLCPILAVAVVRGRVALRVGFTCPRNG